MNKEKIACNFVINPQKYITYENLVKYALKDYRPCSDITDISNMTRIHFFNPSLNNAVIFKIDGAKVHKKLADIYIHISPLQLQAYRKTPAAFYADWEKAHCKQ